MLIFNRETDKSTIMFFCLAIYMLVMSFGGETFAVVASDEWRVYGPTNNVGNAWNENPNPTTSYRCVPIPRNMQLCYGVGYKLMRLPNMLQHETEAEATSQSAHWDMLKKANCHSEMSIFFCSMYAPVCVKDFPEKEIRPCRALCEAVKRDCLPVMQRYGYEWPEMANCSQFPGQKDPMCIPKKEVVNLNCKACKKAEDVTMEFIASSFCLYNLVFKTGINSIREIRTSNGGVERLLHFKKIRQKAFFQTKGVDSRQIAALKTGRLLAESHSKCKCSHLDSAMNRKDQFLIMGYLNRATGEVEIKFVHKWIRSRGEFRKGIRQIRKSLRGRIPDICSNRIIPTKIGPRPSEDTLQSSRPSRDPSNTKKPSAKKQRGKSRGKALVNQRGSKRSLDKNGNGKRNRGNGGRKKNPNRRNSKPKTSKLKSQNMNSVASEVPHEPQQATNGDDTVIGKGSSNEKLIHSSKSPYYRFSK